ncbi:MAG: hypothetical protein RL106_1187 [Bacteroidota bacterium]|jgi:hypothetical protein
MNLSAKEDCIGTGKNIDCKHISVNDFSFVCMKIDGMQRLIDGIAREELGTAADKAKEFGVSIRTMYGMLRAIREQMGAPLVYDRRKKCYRFSEGGRLNLRWQERG